MLDICFSDCVGGNLLAVRSYLDSDVLPINLHLNYGTLCGDIVAKQERLFAESLLLHFPNTDPQEIERNYKKNLKKARRCFQNLEERLQSGESIRVWVSNTAHDRCNLCWLCHFAKDYPAKILVVTCPGYEFNERTQQYIENRNWASFSNLDFMASYAKNAVELTASEVESYSTQWKKLVEVDSPMRVLIDDYIVNVPEDFFDAIILRQIDKTPKSQSRIIGDLLAELQGVDTNFLLSRINFLIKSDKVKICELKTDAYGSTFVQTISKVE